MIIHFYSAEDHIYTMFDAKSNPFKIGDSIKLTVKDFVGSIFCGLNSDFNVGLAKENRQRRALYHCKSIKLVQEEKHLDLETGDFIIKYRCEFEHQ